MRRSRCPNPCVRELAVEPARGARSGVGDGSPGGGGHAAQMQVLAAHEPCPADDPGGALTLPVVLDPGGAGGQVCCPSHPLPVLPRAFAALASRELAQGARLLLERARIGAVEVPAIVQGVGDAVVEAAVHESGHGTAARGHRLARALGESRRARSYPDSLLRVDPGRVCIFSQVMGLREKRHRMTRGVQVAVRTGARRRNARRRTESPDTGRRSASSHTPASQSASARCRSRAKTP